MSGVPLGAPKPMIALLARLYAPLEPYGYALIRIAVGAIFMPHGLQKLFGGGADIIANRVLVGWGLPAPLAWAYGIGMLEFFGGALLALGLFTRPVALLFALEMMVSALGLHSQVWAWNRGGAQYPVFLAVFCLAIVLRGGGRYSLDRRLGKEI